jgi:hypothetical protein
MTQTQTQIIELISNYLNKFPETRFTQALQNLELFETYRIEDKGGNGIVFLHDNFHQRDDQSLDLITNSTVNYNLHFIEESKSK